MSLDLAAEHAGFVIAAYGVSFAVIILMVAATLARARRHRDEDKE